MDVISFKPKDLNTSPLSVFCEDKMPELIKPKEELKLDSKFLVKALVRFIKRDISERYKQTGELTDEDWEFCEKIDWHPVDELPLKESFIKELEEAERGPFVRVESVNEIFESK